GPEDEPQRAQPDRVLDQVPLPHAIADPIGRAGEKRRRQAAANAGGARHACGPHLTLATGTAAFGRVGDGAGAAVAEQVRGLRRREASAKSTRRRRATEANGSASGAAETALAADRGGKCVHLFQLGANDWRDDELRDPLAASKRVRLAR